MQEFYRTGDVDKLDRPDQKAGDPGTESRASDVDYFDDTDLCGTYAGYLQREEDSVRSDY